MTGQPRRRVQPLPPRPDAFMAVLSAANRRRRRRLAVAALACAAALVMAGAGLAIGGIQESSEQHLPATDRNGSSHNSDRPESTSPVRPQAVPSGVPSRSTPAEVQSADPGSGAAARPGGAPRPLRGRVIESGGRPVQGAYVYTGHQAGGRFVPDASHSARTPADGRYEIPCPGSKVLITPWPIMLRIPASQVAHGQTWAAQFVGGSPTTRGASVPACGEARHTTIVPPGGVVTGTVSFVDGCPPGPTGMLRILLEGNPDAALLVGGLSPGETFRLVGLPVGGHVLMHIPSAFGVRISSPGHVVTKDMAVGCQGHPPPDPPSSPPSTTSTPDPGREPSPPESPM